MSLQHPEEVSCQSLLDKIILQFVLRVFTAELLQPAIHRVKETRIVGNAVDGAMPKQMM